MIRRPPRSTRTDTLFPYTTLFRSLGEAPLVAITMGVISACFGGIIRDVLGKEDSIIFSREIYVTAAVAAAATFVGLDAMGVARELSVGLRSEDRRVGHVCVSTCRSRGSPDQ